MQYNIEEINHLIRNRRSVFPKQFVAGKKIPDDIIEQIMINATYAPTHKLTEPWSFKIFTGDGLQTFADFQSELYKKESGENYKEDKYLKLKTTPLLASHIISIGMKRNSGKGLPEIEEVEAVACAVQNIYLSVTAYGLGGYLTTGGITYYENAKPFFGLEEEDKLLGFFYVGYVAVTSPSAKRKSVNEKAIWVR
jgi:nitroreductase